MSLCAFLLLQAMSNADLTALLLAQESLPSEIQILGFQDRTATNRCFFTGLKAAGPVSYHAGGLITPVVPQALCYPSRLRVAH